MPEPEGGAPPQPRLRLHVRWLIRRDLPEVLAIEQASAAAPWNEEEFLRVLRQRQCSSMVVEHGDDIVGFALYRLHKTHIDVLNFAVHPRFRRHGVGRQLVDKLKGKLRGVVRTRLELQVRERNIDALKFFRAQGFLAIDMLREAYADSGEDAIVMEFTHPSDSSDEG